MKVYFVAADGPNIVAHTTPNPEWDKFGHVYLTLEEVLFERGYPGMTVHEVAQHLQEYNRSQGASVQADEDFVQRALDWAEAQGMVISHDAPRSTAQNVDSR